jgi:hypothetical protein
MPGGSRDLSFGHAGAVSDWNICHRAGRGLGSPKEAKMKEPRQTFDRTEALCRHRSGLRPAVR